MLKRLFGAVLHQKANFSSNSASILFRKSLIKQFSDDIFDENQYKNQRKSAKLLQNVNYRKLLEKDEHENDHFFIKIILARRDF